MNDVSRLYSVKNVATLDQHIPDYHMPKHAVKLRADGGLLVAYQPEEEKKKRTFINMAIAHSKEIPNPQKYSKVLKWESDDKKRSAWPRS